MSNTFYFEDPWTWFPDGDESKARTRVEITSSWYDRLESHPLGRILDFLGEAYTFITDADPNVKTDDVMVYGKSFMSENVRFMYDRPATPEEVEATRQRKAETQAKRKAELLAELEELG